MKPKYPNPTLRSTQLGATLTTAITICLGGLASATTWQGTTNSDWNDNSNWAGGTGTGGSNAVISTTPTNIATISANIVATPVDILVGDGTGNNGRLIQNGGTANTGNGNWMIVGRGAGIGKFDLADTSGSGGTLTGFGTGAGTMTVGNSSTGGRLYVGDGGTGTVNVNTSGSLIIRNDLNLGVGTNGTGVVNMDAGTVTTGGWNFIGNGNGSTGTFNQSGGSFTNTGRTYIGGRNAGGTNSAIGHYNISGGTNTNNSNFSVGSGNLTAVSSSTLTITGGTLNAGTTSIGGAAFGGGDANAGKGTADISAGTLNVNGELWVGQSSGSVGALTLSGGAITMNSWVAVGRDSGTGTVNMTGGTWTKTGASNFIVGASGTGTMTMSGGVVDVAASNGTDRGVTWIAETNNSTGILTIQGSAEFRTDVIRVAVNSGTTGTLNLDGGTLKVRQILGGGGTDEVDFNGAQVIATAASPTFISGIDLASVESGGLKVNSNGFTIASNQALSGVGGLVKSGAGTFSLTGANTYTGLTSVTGGKLAISSNTTSGGDITVADGAGLGVIAAALDAQLNSANVTLGATGATSLDVNYSAIVGNPANAPLNVTNTLTLNGTVTVNFTNALPTVGIFPLVAYANQTGIGNLTLGTLPPGVVATLEHDTVNKVYYLDITSVALPRWDGTVDSVWDVNTTQNWTDLISALPSNFLNGNPVLFDDFASGPGGSTVTIGTTVNPASVTFNNSTLNYSLTATAPAGKISGTGGLTKLGTASLTIDALNDYTGVTTLSAGITNVSSLSNAGVAGPLGAATAAASNLVLSGATLNYTGLTASTDRGFTTGGADGVISVVAGTNLTISGPVTGSIGSSLNKQGDGTLTLANSSITLGGGGQANEVLAGTLKFTGPGQTVSVPGELWVGSVPAAAGNLILDGSSLTVDSWMTLGRGNGNSGWVSTITATDSTIHCSNFSAGYDNGLANDSDQTIALTNTTWTNNGMTLLAESLDATTNMTIGGTSVFNANGRFLLALGTNSVANVTIQDAGSLHKIGGWLSVGNGNNGVGTMTVKDSGSLTADGDFNVSDVGTSTGTLNIQNNATVTVGTFFWGKGAGTTGNVNISGGTFTGGISEIAQSANSIAIVTQTGGTVNFGNNDRMWFGQGGTATWNQSAGAANCNGYLVIGRGTTSVAAWNISGGTTSQTTAGQGIILAEQGIGTLTISGTGVVNSAGGQVDIATNGGTGTLNLNSGGTLRAREVVEHNSGTSSVVFDGGTLIANSSVKPDLLHGIDTATINAGGATIDSNGQSFLISQSLQGSGNLVKSGSGTVGMDGINTFTGSTTVTAGALGGTGSLTGSLTVSAGATLAPGHAVGTFTAGATTIAGTYACDVSGSTADKLVVNGTLDVSAATLAINEITPVSGLVRVIATYTGATPAPFASVTGLPAGYSVDYSYGGNQIALIGPVTPFNTWAQANIADINPAADASTGGDPDGDGNTNIVEFALNGNPLSGASSGKVVGKVASVGGTPTLVLTLPVRTGATFSGSTELVSALVDGVIYKVQGSDELVTWNLAVSEVTGTDKTTIESTMPAIDSGWTYRTFQSPGTVTGDPADFLRAVITNP